jgi:CRISPR-associated protein Cas2
VDEAFVEPNFLVMVYDIPNDKRRAKVAKLLESLGERVQYSVFELYLTRPELERLIKRMRKIIAEKEDSIRIYDLCETCRGKITWLGQGRNTAAPGLVIV